MTTFSPLYALPAPQLADGADIQQAIEPLRDRIVAVLQNLAVPYVLFGGAGYSARVSLPAGTTAADGIAFGVDVSLYRLAPDVLRTDDTLNVGGGLQVAGNLGFYGKAPVVRPARPVTLNDVIAALASLGLTA